eukprot:1287878-Pleurochrysis_carterae.AAC.1
MVARRMLADSTVRARLSANRKARAHSIKHQTWVAAFMSCLLTAAMPKRIEVGQSYSIEQEDWMATRRTLKESRVCAQTPANRKTGAQSMGSPVMQHARSTGVLIYLEHGGMDRPGLSECQNSGHRLAQAKLWSDGLSRPRKHLYTSDMRVPSPCFQNVSLRATREVKKLGGKDMQIHELHIQDRTRRNERNYEVCRRR